MKKPIKLCDIHRYLRYYLKYNDISNILTEVAFEIYISCMDNKYVSMLELSKKRCIIMDKYTNIISILSKNLIKLNDKKYENNIDLIGLNKKLSFLNNFSDKIGLSSISGKNLDILSFRILDFIFMCGKERKNGYDKLFGKWFTRNPQMLFKQKGELYILNFLYNFIKCITKELFNGNPIKNPKIFIKNYTDNYLYRDISPYYSSFKSLKIQNLEIENIKTKLEKIGYRCKKATEVSCNFNKIFSVKEISERKLGFELEHQVKYTGSYDYKKMSESDRNKWIKENLYSNAIKYPLLAKAESGLCGDHIDHDACNGKITRDWSNIQLIKKDSVYYIK